MRYLLVMSLSGSVMVGIYVLLRYATRNKISARLQYILAKAAVLYYLIPLPFVRKWYGKVAMRIHPVNKAEILRASPQWDYYAVRANEQLYYNSYTKIQTAVISAWIVVVFVLLAREICDYLQTRRILTRCMEKNRIETDESMEGLKKQCGLKRRIVVYQGQTEEKTMTFGFFKPVILCRQKIGSKEAKLILRHELIHIRRWDTVWKILLRIVVFLHWWNPVAWLLYFDFERVCEWSCDEETVSERTKEETKEYVRLLIAESTKISDEAKPHIRWSAGFGNGAEQLKKRMENIMMMKKWNKIAAGIITVWLVLINSLTVFAYPDVTYLRSENYLSQDEIDSALEADEWIYIPDGTDVEQLADITYYGMDNDIHIIYDKQFTDAEGNIYSIEEENSTDVYASCTHSYVSGNLVEHIKNTSGGCTVKTYSAQRCSKCGEVLMGDLLSTAQYSPCPH